MVVELETRLHLVIVVELEEGKPFGFCWIGFVGDMSDGGWRNGGEVRG